MPPAPVGSCRRKYVEKVGEDGFKKAPIGAGPYKFVSFTPGVELVLEAFEQYWRKTPSVKRIVLQVIPDESTRLAALKRGEIDIAYSIRGRTGRGAAAHAGPDAAADGRVRRRTTCISPSNGTRSRRGTIVRVRLAAKYWRSTATPSTRR